MSRSASKRPSTSTRSGSTLQTTPSTSHDFKPSPLDAILAEQGLQRYRLEPPSWRAPWAGSEGSNNGDVEEDEGKRGLTWPVFYPTKDGMDEDQLTEAAVKQGYAAKLPIQVRSFFRCSLNFASCKLTVYATIGRYLFSSWSYFGQSQGERNARELVEDRDGGSTETRSEFTYLWVSLCRSFVRGLPH